MIPTLSSVSQSTNWIQAVISALEIPDCECAVDLACPCGESCPPGSDCIHCREECDCPPAGYQPPCRHILDAVANPALQRWLALVAEHAPPEGGEKAQDFLIGQLQLLLLDHAADDYRDPPRPPLPLMAVGWEAHIGELARREGRYALRSDFDAKVRSALQFSEVAHRGRNGALIHGTVVSDRKGAQSA